MVQPVRLALPQITGRSEGSVVRSSLARLIASGAASSRVALVRATGLSRTAVNTHLEPLLAAGVVVEDGQAAPEGRGRPAHRLALAPRAGVVAVADVGTQSAYLAVADLDQTELARRHIALDVSLGPSAGLDALARGLLGALEAAGVAPAAVRCLVVGLPGPVDPRLGRPVRPPIMPGWDGFPVGDALRDRFGCPVLVDNDVNLRALGEARARPPQESPLLYLTVGTGIGGGLVDADGVLHRGADGAAGDIGHVRVSAADDVVCVCGNVGCVEAVASAGAVLRRLRAGREDLVTIEDLADRLRSGDPDAVRAVREAAEPIGEVVAALVHFYNPRTIVVGGLISSASDDVLAGVRAVVYRRALPLATRNLLLGHSVLGDGAGLAGGVAAGIEAVLAPDHIDALLGGASA
ncbi:ROK family protein [Streptomyces sp. NPDC006134]|uniref:ROK family transcriptional regulator n=1 Tax=Streptomyces sp. NPDC006134 TaxID=3154467 RepID=UPI0033EB14FF